MGSMTIFFFMVAILIVGVASFVTIALTKRSGKVLDSTKYQQRWLKIEASLQKDNPATYQTSILHADKRLDMALKERAFGGQTMGERMKSAQNVWSNANHVWGAHKIRNRIAHEPDAEITYEVAARALVAFKQALRDLGAF